MTIPPLRHAISYWTIRIEHHDWFNRWPVSRVDDVFVSPTGYPATKAFIALPTQEMAEAFLTAHRETIDRRCASKPEFISYQIVERHSYWPIDYNELIDLAVVGKRGRPRIRSQKSK